MLTCCRCGGLTPPESSTECLHCDAPLRRPPRWALRLSALLGPAGAILLAACYGAPGRYYAVREPSAPPGAKRYDLDHDGARGPYVCAEDADPSCAAQVARMPPPEDVDCDDLDPARFPGAADVEGDGVDSNCDGVDGWRDPRATVQPVPAELVRAPAASPPAHVAVPAQPASPPAQVAVPPATP